MVRMFSEGKRFIYAIVSLHQLYIKRNKMKIMITSVFLLLNGISGSVMRTGLEADPIADDQSCGTSGYTLDAPIPGVQHRKRRRRAATNDAFKTWPQGTIPYNISPDFSNTAIRLINRAMHHWMNETCVEFVTRTTEDDYVYIYKGPGCCSYVGRRGGKQFLSLGIGCLRFGIITHELGHAVGFWHEQNRPDRSIYIDIIYDNVKDSKYLNFDQRKLNEVTIFDQVYDYKSIMHYGNDFFTKNGGKTIEKKNLINDIHSREIGHSYYKYQGPTLSQQDILETNLLYQCSKMTECGGTIFANSGSFTSINYPREYPRDEQKDCIWIVTTTKNKKYGGMYTSLTLLFNHFNVGQPNKDNTEYCDDDYVEVREGKGFLSPFIVRYCGNRKPAPITTLTGSLYIRFHMSGKNGNDVSSYYEGFSANFKSDACSQHITKFPARIQSPQFPSGYEPEKDCVWVINALKGMQVELIFPFFTLRELDNKEGCLDYVEIHEGEAERFIGRFCGSNNPDRLLVKSEKVKVHFHASDADHKGWFMGFQAIIDQLDINECELGLDSCTQVCLNYPGGYFCGCYPGYKNVYQRNERHTQCVDKDECSVNNGECSHFCVNTDGSYLCACPSGYVLSANKTHCVDINECVTPKKPCTQICKNTVGSFQCSCYHGFILQNNNMTCIELFGCKGVYTSSAGSIVSPRIPSTYGRTVSCLWSISAPKHLKLAIDVQLPWHKNPNCSHFIKLYDNERAFKRNLFTKKVCQQVDADQTITMSNHTALLEFEGTKPFLPQFTLNYRSVSPEPKTCVKTFNSSHGRLHTPGFPYKYPDSTDCIWSIYSPRRTVMKFRFLQFSVEYHENCQFDYIAIEEVFYEESTVKVIGKFCGDSKPPAVYINGVTSFVRLKFHSDSTVNSKGFKLSFKEMKAYMTS